jgi:hypothetical protein
MKSAYLLDTDWAIDFLNGHQETVERIRELKGYGLALSAYPKNPPKGMSEGKNPLASRFASVGPLCQRGQRRRSRAGDL